MKSHDALTIKRIILEVSEQLKKLEELFAEWKNRFLNNLPKNLKRSRDRRLTATAPFSSLPATLYF